MREAPSHPMFLFGWPGVPIVCLGILLWLLGSLYLKQSNKASKEKSRLLLLSAGLTAFFLSHFYREYYLLGSSRIIDATSYLLEARTLAEGSFSFETLASTANYKGRFLLPSWNHPGQFSPPQKGSLQ